MVDMQRPLFRISVDAGLPPFPDESRRDDRNPLEHLIEALIAAAGGNVIPAPASVPDAPSMTDAFDALRVASEQFDIAPGIPLSDRFWTHAADFHSGAVAARLRAATCIGQPAQGFLAMYARDVCSPLVYSPSARPVRLREGIGRPNDVGGPFLALILCQSVPDGRAEAIMGFAVPIYHARRFMPIRSELERDVLRTLEHLQVTLDAYGNACTIERQPFDVGKPTARLLVTAVAPGGIERRVLLTIDPGGQFDDRDRSFDFIVTQDNWKDGRFIAWLAAAIGHN